MSAISWAVPEQSRGVEISRRQFRQQPVEGERRHRRPSAKGRGDVLVEMVGIERRVNDLLALRHRDGEIAFGEAAADAEDHICLVEEVPHGLGHRQSTGAERERMILREGALAAEAGRDRRAKKLGELAQSAPGARPNARPAPHRGLGASLPPASAPPRATAPGPGPYRVGAIGA